MRVAIALMPLAFWTSTAVADAPNARVEQGRAIFARHCSGCHGAHGEGGGPAVREGQLAPPDLRRIAERREGRFDAREIAAIIDGRVALAAHSSREMPVWGDLQLRARPAEPGANGGRPAEIDALVAWLASIQHAR